MEGSKKFEDAALRGITRHHVWTSRTSDLTVINLRDPYELLGTQEAAAAAPVVVEVKRQAAPPSPPPASRPAVGKQESLSALLSKLQLGRPATDSITPPKPPQQPAASPAVQATAPPGHVATPQPAAAAPAAAPAAASAPLPPPPPPPPPPAPAAPPKPSPPVHATEAHNPIFPDLRDSSSSTAGQFEFITGTNIPGQGVVKRAEVLNEVSSMALFHDPLWGGSVADAFSSPPPTRPSPKPQHRTALSELYAASAAAAATATTAPATRGYVATPSTATHTPVASPPVSTMAAPTPLPTAMTPQHLSMMSGLMSAPAAQLTAPYPMYSMPLQYVAQPQFPGGVMYNPGAFFPYGTPAMMMAQPQHLPQGYPVAPTAMMRPGTNVKAMPFVPGSTL